MASARASKVVAWIAAASLWAPFGTAAAEPVPVQRPGALTQPPAPSETPPATSETAPAETPPVDTTPSDAPASDATNGTTPSDAAPNEVTPSDATADATTATDAVPTQPAEPKAARIIGVVLDTEQAGIGVPDATITVSCPCLGEPIITHSDYDGRFTLDDLTAGTYTLRFDRGGRRSERVVSIGTGQRLRLDVKVAPPTETRELERRAKIETRSSTMIAVGSIAAIGGLVMIIGGIIEANKPPCMFGLDECSNQPRPAVAKGMGIGGAVALAGGAALVGFGVAKRLRLRAAIEADNTHAALVLRGRF